MSRRRPRGSKPHAPPSRSHRFTLRLLILASATLAGTVVLALHHPEHDGFVEFPIRHVIG